MRVEPHPTNLAKFLSGTVLLDKTGFFKKVSPILPGLILEKGNTFSKKASNIHWSLSDMYIKLSWPSTDSKSTVSDGTSGAQPR